MPGRHLPGGVDDWFARAQAGKWDEAAEMASSLGADKRRAGFQNLDPGQAEQMRDAARRHAPPLAAVAADAEARRLSLASETAMGEHVKAGMDAANEPGSHTPTSGIWYSYNYRARNIPAIPAPIRWRKANIAAAMPARLL